MKKLTQTLILLTALLSVSSITSSCNPKYELELSKLDTLELHLAAAEEYLKVDPELIAARIEEIEANIRTIRNKLNDTVDLEFGNNMSKYKTILKIYRKNQTAYAQWSKEHEELKTQVENLRKDLEAGKLSREEFKEYYFQEKEDIIALREGAKSVQKSLYEIEPDYMRLSEFAEETIAELEENENQ
ncbi:hypothetical protein GYB29_05360 [bacterium]|nr:hypothetical protein [bacterium]